MFKNVFHHLKAKPVCGKKYSDVEMEHLKKVIELKNKDRKATWYKHNATKVKESTSQRLKNRSKTEIAIDKQVKKSYDKERRNHRSRYQINMEKEKKKVYNAKWLEENAEWKKHANNLNNFFSHEYASYDSFHFKSAEYLVIRCLDGKISNLKSILESENRVVSDLPDQTSKLDVSEMFVWFDNEMENLRDTLKGTIEHFFCSIKDMKDKQLIEKKIRFLNQHIYGCLNIFNCQVKELLNETTNFEMKKITSKIKLYHEQMGEKLEHFDNTVQQLNFNFNQSVKVDYREAFSKFRNDCHENLKLILKKYSSWTKKYQDYLVQMKEWKNGDKTLIELLKTIDSDLKECQEEIEHCQTINSSSKYLEDIDDDDEEFETNLTNIFFWAARNMEVCSKSIRCTLWNTRILADSNLELYGVKIDQSFDEQWFGFFPRNFITVKNESQQKERERFAQNAKKTVIDFMEKNHLPIDYEDFD